MENDKDYIDSMYSKKFEKFEYQASDDDWNMLNSKLTKSNFLKFSFATFNVFFLGAFLSFAGIATFFGVNSISQSNKIERLEQKIEVLQKQTNENEANDLIIDSVGIEETENRFETKKENNAKMVSGNNGLNEKIIDDNEKLISVSPELNSKADSIEIKTDSLAILNKEQQKITRIKKTTFIKKDKVFVTDTVVVKKQAK